MKKKLNFLRRGLKKIICKKSSYDEMIKECLDRNFKLGQELLLAMKFNNTITDSEWFIHKSISPGESAIDYGFCYTLFRVLSTIKPSNILEFGLGQSSKMVHQYANHYQKKATTVEHDKDWVVFFKEDVGGKYPINVKMLDLGRITLNGHEALSYKDCHSTFNGQKFDLIIVDGPFGYAPDIYYSRPQIIDLVKDCLTENFVIIIDDYDRQGEKNTVKEIFSFFDQVQIPYVYRVYSTSKQHILITTPSQKFLTTL